MNAAQEKRARELLRTAAIQGEIDAERRDKDAELASLGAELLSRQQESDRLRAKLDANQVLVRRLREQMGLVEAHMAALRDILYKE